jgi:diguanylate cyclase (GGDEF)-like protein
LLFAQENGIPNFFIWEPDILGEPTPVGVRDEYVPVYLMPSRYPEADDIDTMGLDLAWYPERMDSKWLARDTGLAQSSDFFPILLGPGSNMAPMGFAITLPVYAGGELPTNQAKRREKAIGYLAGVYELALLLGNELDQLKAKGINLRLSDASENVYQVDFEGVVPSEFSHQFDTQFFGKTWNFGLTAKEAMVDDLNGFRFYWYSGGLALLFLLLIKFLFYQEKMNVMIALSEESLAKANFQLELLARHDPLTNLLNRRGFFERLGNVLDEIERRSRPASLLMLDIDWFKKINDTHGHAQGDVVLKALAEKCTDIIRRVDIMGRIGGEEFAIVLPEAAAKDAYVLAERLRAAIASLEVSLGPEKTPVSFTVSIGFASISEPIDSQTWLEQADHALYHAKQNGRNRVSEYQAEMNPLGHEPSRFE